jgi:hypothetical protein
MWERHPAANKKKLKNSNLSITKPKTRRQGVLFVQKSNIHFSEVGKAWLLSGNSLRSQLDLRFEKKGGG